MKRCIKCILPESFPGISFDSKGVCSVCLLFAEQRQFIPSIERLRNKMNDVINEHKVRKLKYNALVALSGGKDSTYLLYLLKEKYDLDILAFTFDNGFLSGQSFRNIEKVLKVLNIDHVMIKPKAGIMKEIFQTSADFDIYPEYLVKFGSSICISCIRMVSNFAVRIAIEKKIPMVMLGHSPGQIIQSENEIIYKDNFIPHKLRKQLFKPLADKVGEEVYYYLMLTEEEYKTKPFPYTINTFPLIGYNEDEIYKTIKTLGWEKPEDVDPNSTNCQLNSLGIIRHKERFRFHPYDYEMSMLVRMGIINRDQALQRIEDPHGKTVEFSKIVEKEFIH